MSEYDYDLTEGVDEDGAIEDPFQDIETYYCPLESIAETEHYLRITGDNGGTNVEIRVPVKALVDAGWTPPAKSFAERVAEQEPEPELRWIQIGPEGPLSDPAGGEA